MTQARFFLQRLRHPVRSYCSYSMTVGSGDWSSRAVSTVCKHQTPPQGETPTWPSTSDRKGCSRRNARPLRTAMQEVVRNANQCGKSRLLECWGCRCVIAQMTSRQSLVHGVATISSQSIVCDQVALARPEQYTVLGSLPDSFFSPTWVGENWLARAGGRWSPFPGPPPPSLAPVRGLEKGQRWWQIKLNFH